MTVRAVFFDLDDTLYPYEPCNEAGKRAAHERARELGYDLDREAFDRFYRRGRRETKRELVGTASAHERYLYFKHAVQLHSETHRAYDALALGDAYWDAYVEAMELFDGVEETFERLRAAGKHIVVVSNLTTHVQLRKVDELGIEDYIDRLLTSEEIGREKPSAFMFTLPTAQLDLRPSEVLMVGNDPESDVLGANAIGMTTALFNAEGADGGADPADADDPDALPEDIHPDYRLDAFDEVLEVVL